MSTRKQDAPRRSTLAARIPHRLHQDLLHLAVDAERPVQSLVEEAVSTLIERTRSGQHVRAEARV
jgi:hypothetical protein